MQVSNEHTAIAAHARSWAPSGHALRPDRNHDTIRSACKGLRRKLRPAKTIPPAREAYRGQVHFGGRIGRQVEKLWTIAVQNQLMIIP